MRRFQLNRQEDATGLSGTGIVAEGVEFYDGSCALKWVTPYNSMVFYTNIKVLEHLHGHDGKTKVEWLDE